MMLQHFPPSPYLISAPLISLEPAAPFPSVPRPNARLFADPLPYAQVAL